MLQGLGLHSGCSVRKEGLALTWIRKNTSIQTLLRQDQTTCRHSPTKGQRILRQAMPALLVLTFGAPACQAQSLEGITTVTTNFLTWLRAFLGIVGVIAIVWGGARIMFSGDIGRGLAGVFAGIVGRPRKAFVKTIYPWEERRKTRESRSTTSSVRPRSSSRPSKPGMRGFR
jgi:hypothetical protein